MADEYNLRLDLGRLLMAALDRNLTDAGHYAERITGHLGIGEDDSPAAAGEEIARALAPEPARPDPETVRGLIASAVQYPARWTRRDGRTVHEQTASAVMAVLAGHGLAVTAMPSQDASDTAGAINGSSDGGS